MSTAADKWELMAGSGSATTCKANTVVSKVLPYDPSVLPFDHLTHTAVEIHPQDQLFGLVMAHLVQHSSVVPEDAISFEMSRAEKGRGKKGPCGCGSSAHAETGQDLSTIGVTLGLGLFRFEHEGVAFRALHQEVGEPVGGNCGATVYHNLVLFTQGTGHEAMTKIRTFLASVLAASEKTSKNTFQIYRWHLQAQFWQRVSKVVARPVSSVVLPSGTAESLVEDMKEFLAEETAEFYNEHGIPYKRSYLFYGVPGAGKTSTIQALAGRFGRNLCYLSPTHPELTDDALKSAIERVPHNAIVVLEDVDALFGKDRNKKIAQSPLTFSGLLNALDGVGNHEGLIFILTTNFKDQLDAALIRDGRVDVRTFFDYCGPDQMVQMFENFYPSTKAPAHDLANGASCAEDTEIALLEAKLAALKKSRASGTVEAEGQPSPSGAAFRDALLLALGERKISTAQLQSFFVTHRKKSAAEAIADVKSIADAVDERQKEEEEEEAKKKKGEEPAAGGEQNRGAQDPKPPGAAAHNGRVVHVHVHND